MTLPPGFTATLFAGEPDVVQPIAFTHRRPRPALGRRGATRIPIRAPEGKGKDRILIFEDTDGDGKFDKRTVFAEKLNLVSGLEVGFGGVWVGAAPYLLFIPDKDGDDKPDGAPQVLLDGWGYQDTHETLNTLHLGPRRLALRLPRRLHPLAASASPARPTSSGMPINAGIWRYHPTQHVFEVFAHGTSNPWGLDFNDARPAASSRPASSRTCCHIIQGGRYQRQAGQHFNPYTYADIKTDRRPPSTTSAPNPHGGNNRIRRRRRRPRPLRRDDLPRRHLAGGVPRPDLHEQHPRPAASTWTCPSRRAPATSATHGPDFLTGQRRAGRRFINLRYGPGRQRLHDRLVRQAGSATATSPRSARPRRTAASSRSATADAKPAPRSTWRS